MKLSLLLILGLGFTITWSISGYLMNHLRRHVARVAYDGTDFKGFQAQKTGLRTVQQTLNDIFSARLRKSIVVTGASRTDTGVHALGQAFHFDCDAIDDIPAFEHSINCMLPTDVKISETSIAPPRDADGKPFHACGSATGKWYRYSFCNKRFIDPLKAKYCGHFWRPLDMDLLERSLELYVGTHNFSAFGNQMAQQQIEFDKEGQGMKVNPIRTVQSVKLSKVEEGYYTIDFHLHSALQKMVRNMVGTSWLVAEGSIALEEQRAYLRDGMKRLKNKGSAAPAEGLCLQRVYYDNY